MYLTILNHLVHELRYPILQAHINLSAGSGTIKDMKQAAVKLLQDKHITAIKSLQQWQDFLASQALPVVILVSEKAAASPLYKALSLRFKNHLVFARASAKTPGLSAALGIDSIPGLAVVKDSSVDHFTGISSPQARHNRASKYK